MKKRQIRKMIKAFRRNRFYKITAEKKLEDFLAFINDGERKELVKLNANKILRHINRYTEYGRELTRLLDPDSYVYAVISIESCKRSEQEKRKRLIFLLSLTEAGIFVFNNWHLLVENPYKEILHRINVILITLKLKKPPYGIVSYRVDMNKVQPPKLSDSYFHNLAIFMPTGTVSSEKPIEQFKYTDPKKEES